MNKSLIPFTLALVSVCAGTIFAQQQFDLSQVSNAQILEEVQYRLNQFKSPVMKKLDVYCQNRTIVIETHDGYGKKYSSYARLQYATDWDCQKQADKVADFTKNTYDADRLNRFAGYRSFSFCWVDAQDYSRMITMDIDETGFVNKIGEFRVLTPNMDYRRNPDLQDRGAMLCDGLTDAANRTLLNGISRRDQDYGKNPRRGGRGGN